MQLKHTDAKKVSIIVACPDMVGRPALYMLDIPGGGHTHAEISKSIILNPSGHIELPSWFNIFKSTEKSTFKLFLSNSPAKLFTLAYMIYKKNNI